jgi:uncharacterized protein with HEPN domain
VRDDAVYLDHILECVRRIEANTADGYESFMSSHTLQDAVLRNLQTMAESTQRLTDSVKARRPDVEWRQLAAFRNVMVHGYLGVDLHLVWEIIHHDVPRLKAAVESLARGEAPGA